MSKVPPHTLIKVNYFVPYTLQLLLSSNASRHFSIFQHGGLSRSVSLVFTSDQSGAEGAGIISIPPSVLRHDFNALLS